MGPELQDKGSLTPQRRLAWLMALLAPLILGPLWLLLFGKALSGILLGTLAGMIVMLLIVTCTYTDLRYRKIPNWATYSAFVWALVLNGTMSALGLVPPTSEFDPAGSAGWIPVLARGSVGIASCLLGAGICFFIMIFIYEVAGGGAGDVKLMTALGALLGWEHGLQALIYSYVVAGVLLLCWSIWTMGPIYLFKALLRKIGSVVLPYWVAQPSTEQDQFLKRRVPLSLFFALGTLPILLGLDLSW